ncbi:hypothetical protein RB653_007946 [Dictyostelium firmibasis]|uniref:Pyrrolidone-carboxylate peptidase n=1 Tax=Dictyostelium firmibasis TaxID=79012 RepID=A0AAN7YV38_9MYCE
MNKKKIILSGFGTFCGVSDNPSSQLVNEIQMYIESLPNKDELRFEIINANIIKVSGTDVRYYLEQMEINHLKTSNDDDMPILIHFGVSSAETNNRLEVCGWNLADFRCYDENMWKPQNEPIDSQDTNDKYETTLPINDLVEKLSKNYKVTPSVDPGRFVCNYLYFLSLRLSKSYETQSLFIHIPLFNEIDKRTQLKFMVDLFDSIPKNNK